MCRSMPKITDNTTATTRYDFDVPIHQAEEEDDEDLKLSEKMVREIREKGWQCTTVSRGY